jgi:AraC-like DNA-binding protein
MSESRLISSEHFARRNEDIHVHLSSELPNYQGIKHRYDCIIIIFIITGKMRFELENKVYEAEKGDMILINKDVPFTYTEDDSCSAPLLFYSVMFNSAFRTPKTSLPDKLMSSSFAFYSIKDNDITPYLFFKFSTVSNSAYGEYINKMYVEYKNAKSGYNEALLAFLTLIVLNAARLNERLTGGDPKTNQLQAVSYVQEYINRCYNDYNISVAGLADRVYLNPDYLGRIFKRHTGSSITEALQKKRVEQVCYLLTTTDRPINEIAIACGFAEMHFFYNVFKKRMGVLPGEYRENTKK